MVRRKDEQTESRKCIRGGNGEVLLRALLNGDEEMNGKGRMFDIITVEPGQSVGFHQHSGDSETFYILSGTATYNDNGTTVELRPGDVALCRDGESHALENNGAEPVSLIALILYA